jgi:DEAD/DEAH box helicase domain-containing protein
MLDTTHSVKETWFYRYLIKSFQLVPKDIGRVNDFYFKLLDVLTDVGVLNKVQSASGSTYAIEPKAIIVEKSVKVFQCDKCTSVLYVAESDKLTQGSSCLDYQCTGKYQALPPSKPNYYQAIYNRNRSPRIRAAEHTGILERKDRENKEFDFKERPNFNSLNAIVATSTLEMGIDIGTLNTAINNSIPPQTSNFLQRVGRAGRSSGSALLINFAQNKPHDLFYYNAPSDMMEGEIATPACFMEAKDILFRHFLAFCFDKWSSADPIHNSIPRNIFSLRLFNTDIQGHEFFGNKIISFIKSNEQNLLNEFCSFYQPDIHDEKVFVSLRENLSNETLYNRVKDVFVKLKSEYTYIFEKRSEIDDFIKTQKLGESDQERKILDEEKKALWGLKRIIDQRSLLEHLTNVGLLPNYAFPETGVTLNAWIKNIPAKGSSALPIDNQFEIVRSASSAIRELAPENYFYSQGFKFQVSGLNTHDWREEGTLIKKRFCSNCDNLEDAINSTQKTCPKCGDASWSSINNIHTFVRLSGVKSFNFKPTSTLDDSSDEREALHYNVSRHIKFDNSSRQGAWGMKDIPFGIEYVKNVKLSSANLGLSSSVDANKITINNMENIPSHGFITCKYCGKSTSSPHKSDYEKPSSFHFGYCKHKNSKYEGKSDGVFEEVFLYREFNTEAMKILLPVQELDEETKVNLFKAGLELGLKKYYKGNPQHLSILDYREYNEQNSRFDRYVIICDNISGGTGYLEKLFNPQEFTQVLKLAHTAIKDCSCKTKGKDGCYRCIYTYANQRNQRSLSRALAEKMFENIVAKTDSWESYTTGLGSLSGNGQIEESELEERFIRSLRKYVESKVSEGWVFEETIQDGVLNYKIQMRKDGNRYSYYVRPQMELNQVHGVAERTRTDFYITLTDVNIGGESIIEQSHLHSFKNIAIYLDGYTYHASKENQRFIGDLKKRQSILNSGDKITWSLTWSDLELFDEINPEKRNDEYVHLQRYNTTKQKWLKIPNVKDANSELFTSQNSFERLLWLLLHPLETDCSKKKLALFLATLQEEFGKPSCDEDFMQECLSKAYVMQDDLKAINISEGRFFVFPNIQLRNESHFVCKTGIKASNLEIQSRFYIAETQQEIPKESWESFWRLYNLLQESVEVIFESNEQMPQESNQF